MTEPDTPPSTNPIIRFFSNPLVGIIGTVASIIGIILTVYFYLATREVPQLTYFVHPVKSLIVAAGQFSRLSVTFDNKPIATDVTAAQVAFWNNGTRSIRRKNILRPLVIRVGNRLPILEVRLLKKSRDVVIVEFDNTRLQEGELAVTWNILEHNDGGVVQFIFAGPADTSITAEATVEGQQVVEALSFPGTILSPSEQYAQIGQQHTQRVISLLLVMCLATIACGLVYNDPKRRWWYIFFPHAILALCLILLVLQIYWLISNRSTPPFGF